MLEWLAFIAFVLFYLVGMPWIDGRRDYIKRAQRLETRVADLERTVRELEPRSVDVRDADIMLKNRDGKIRVMAVPKEAR